MQCTHSLLNIVFSARNINPIIKSIDMRIVFEHFDSWCMHINFDVELLLDILFDFNPTPSSKQWMGMMFDPF